MIKWSTQPCPRCGRQTDGAISEGGCRWALCPDCMRRQKQEARKDRDVRPFWK